LVKTRLFSSLKRSQVIEVQKEWLDREKDDLSGEAMLGYMTVY